MCFLAASNLYPSLFEALEWMLYRFNLTFKISEAFDDIGKIHGFNEAEQIS